MTDNVGDMGAFSFYKLARGFVSGWFAPPGANGFPFDHHRQLRCRPRNTIRHILKLLSSTPGTRSLDGTDAPAHGKEAWLHRRRRVCQWRVSNWISHLSGHLVSLHYSWKRSCNLQANALWMWKRLGFLDFSPIEGKTSCRLRPIHLYMLRLESCVSSIYYGTTSLYSSALFAHAAKASLNRWRVNRREIPGARIASTSSWEVAAWVTLIVEKKNRTIFFSLFYL